MAIFETRYHQLRYPIANNLPAASQVKMLLANSFTSGLLLTDWSGAAPASRLIKITIYLLPELVMPGAISQPVNN
jgi:hypothetical protein